MCRPNRKKCFSLVMVLTIILILTAATASAHRVIVFAWVEGDTVFTQSKFSGGKKVIGGEILVYDAKENKLVEGKTDEKGEFSFKVPKKETLIVVLQTGAGHRGEWTIPVEEIQPGGVDGVIPGKEMAVKKSSVTTENKGSRRTLSGGLSKEDVEIVVEKALEVKLKPIMKQLAESKQENPSLQDIIGGLGYIIGLVGAVAYFRYRRKGACRSSGK